MTGHVARLAGLLAVASAVGFAAGALASPFLLSPSAVISPTTEYPNVAGAILFVFVFLVIVGSLTYLAYVVGE